MRCIVKAKKAPTKKEMQRELELFRKLSMQMVANKIFLEYQLASSFISIEPEGFVDECIKMNFPRLQPEIKDKIWSQFLSNLVMIRKKVCK